MSEEYDLIIAGAGIVGVSTALWAQKLGLSTLVIDPNPAGSGTTYGPACTLANYSVTPVNSPSVIRSLPRLLLSKDSPLSFSWGHALRNPGWMLSFLANCRPSRVKHITQELGSLCRQADEGLDPLIEEARAEDLLAQTGFISIATSKAGFLAQRQDSDISSQHGFEFQEVGPDEIRALEPHLKAPLYGGFYRENVRHVKDPMALCQRMQARAVELGGGVLSDRVVETRPDDQGVTIRTQGGTQLRAKHFVLAAGAHSKAIRGAGAERLPLGTERGYHLCYAQHGDKLSRPVGWVEGGFYSVPMAEGLRLAGTVEIASLTAPPNKERLAYMRRRGEELFGPLGKPDQEWLGFRPTMPDALPVIGPAPGAARVLHAFGHQHLGLTLGGITGRMVANIAQSNDPAPEVSGLSAARFL